MLIRTTVNAVDRVRLPNAPPSINIRMNDNNDEIQQKLAELMEPINQQIMMCDERTDLLILAFGMMNRSKDIIDQQLGEIKRRSLFKEHS